MYVRGARTYVSTFVRVFVVPHFQDGRSRAHSASGDLFQPLHTEPFRNSRLDWTDFNAHATALFPELLMSGTVLLDAVN